MDLSKRKQIRALLLVVGSGIGTALALALAMLYYYNPSGSYLAKNVLLAPQSVPSMHYADTNSRIGGGASRFVFDGIEFSYFDSVSKQWKRPSINLEKYTEFYGLVGNDKSLTEVSDEVKSFFLKGHPSTLAVNVHAESDATLHPISKAFLQVSFVEGDDYYRIQLRQHSASEEWAYFYHPGIYHQSTTLFLSR